MQNKRMSWVEEKKGTHLANLRVLLLCEVKADGCDDHAENGPPNDQTKNTTRNACSALNVAVRSLIRGDRVVVLCKKLQLTRRLELPRACLNAYATEPPCLRDKRMCRGCQHQETRDGDLHL